MAALRRRLARRHVRRVMREARLDDPDVLAAASGGPMAPPYPPPPSPPAPGAASGVTGASLTSASPFARRDNALSLPVSAAAVSGGGGGGEGARSDKLAGGGEKSGALSMLGIPFGSRSRDPYSKARGAPGETPCIPCA